MKAVRTGPEEIIVIHNNGEGVVVEHFRRADVINLSGEAIREIAGLTAELPVQQPEGDFSDSETNSK